MEKVPQVRSSAHRASSPGTGIERGSGAQTLVKYKLPLSPHPPLLDLETWTDVHYHHRLAFENNSEKHLPILSYLME